LDADGPIVRSEADALDLLGEIYGSDADLIALPLARVDASFFDLKSGLLGAVTQKFANYGVRLAVIGDISERVAASNALRDYVYEANKGGRILFVNDMDALRKRLG